MSSEWKTKYSATEKTEGVKTWGRLVKKQEKLLDRPAVGSGAAKQAAVVTLPAAAPPAGREHLPVDEALISAVSRHAPSQCARLHLLHEGERLERYRSADITNANVRFSCPLIHNVRQCSQLQARYLSFPFSFRNEWIMQVQVGGKIVRKLLPPTYTHPHSYMKWITVI